MCSSFWLRIVSIGPGFGWSKGNWRLGPRSVHPGKSAPSAYTSVPERPAPRHMAAGAGNMVSAFCLPAVVGGVSSQHDGFIRRDSSVHGPGAETAEDFGLQFRVAVWTGLRQHSSLSPETGISGKRNRISARFARPALRQLAFGLFQVCAISPHSSLRLCQGTRRAGTCTASTRKPSWGPVRHATQAASMRRPPRAARVGIPHGSLREALRKRPRLPATPAGAFFPLMFRVPAHPANAAVPVMGQLVD